MGILARQYLLQPWFRLSRGLTLGVRGLIRDNDGRVLLVRHGYVPGWHLPGGGVERGETMLAALHREVEEETGVAITDQAKLFAIYHSGVSFPGDHVGLFVVEGWRQACVPVPNAEILEQGFFTLKDLPDGTTEGTRRRLLEVTQGLPLAAEW